MSEPLRVAVAPAGVRPWLEEAVVAGGGSLVPVDVAEALVWADAAAPADLAALLDAHGAISWVQLPWAGVEAHVPTIRRHDHLVWTCGKGVYAQPVAEHALALGLAGLRGVVTYGCATSWREPGELGVTLRGAHVVVLGAGGITEVLLDLLAPFGASVTVVRRRAEPMAGADRTVTLDDLHAVLPTTDLLVLALALTPETVRVIGAQELALLPRHAWLVNVARGAHVDTDALVAALRAGTIGGAALDVTDPEPLPDNHALWTLPNCLVTPHVGNTSAMAVPLLAARVTENVERRGAGRELLGLVDPAAGY